MKTNEFLAAFNRYVTLGDTPIGMMGHQINRPYAICKDGFSISIQASKNHYCSPRLDMMGEYDEVELGFPSQLDELIDDFAEDPDTTQTVYGYVPVEVVDALLEKHGGIVKAHTAKTPWESGWEVDDCTMI